MFQIYRNPALLVGLALATVAGAAGPDEVARSADRVRPLLVGADVPEVQVTAADGAVVDLRAISDGKPTIFLFYRGGW